MILGPGGVGKSSLLKGLKNEQLPEEANSTQMAEINTFQPGVGGSSREVSSHLASCKEAEAYWTDVTEEDEMNELIGLVRLVYNVSSGHITSSRVFPGLSTTSADILQRSGTSSVHVSAAHKIIAEVIELAKQYPDTQACNSEVFLSTWDCGGQQVFLCILSAFLTSKSMFFDARYSLHDRRISLSHHRGNVTEHAEEATVAELLLQWMSCIDATLSDSSAKTPQYPRILPIGTHGDDERVKKEKEDILKQLYEEYRGKNFLRLIPEKGFIIDNTTAGKGDCEDPGYKKILKMIHEFASKKLAEVDTPITWVLFIKRIAKTQPCFKMEEVKEIAGACMIPEDSVPSILKFYHDRAVFFHYSHISSLKDYVIANPQWLIRQIAKVLDLNESTILQNKQEILRKSGILVEDFYTEVLESTEETTTLPPQAIVDLLEDFLILTPVNTGSKVHGKEYFVPSVLPPLLDNTSATSTHESMKKAASLHVIFPNVNYLPPGYFTRLAIVLSKEPGFNLAFGRGVYRNMIPFIVGESGSEIDTLTISKCASSVQIDLIRKTPRQNDNPFFFEVCQSSLNHQ